MNRQRRAWPKVRVGNKDEDRGQLALEFEPLQDFQTVQYFSCQKTKLASNKFFPKLGIRNEHL